MSTVLVTGESGFIGTYCILQFAGGSSSGCLFAADLGKDAGWPEAISGCDYVLHVASPFPAGFPVTKMS
jgi:nucleoside-diphosphate-sugar epimerase